MARQPWDAAECGLVRPPCSSEDVEDRERHGDRDALEDAEQCHTKKCSDREQELDGPVRAAKDEAVEIVSVSATSAIPSAPAISSGRSDTDSMLGTVSDGNPWGRVPTSETPWPARSSSVDAAIATRTATSTPGIRGS